MTKVLVCGGRNFGEVCVNDFEGEELKVAEYRAEKEREFLFKFLNWFHNDYAKITHLIHGGAKGADYYAQIWAQEYPDIMTKTYEADWKKHGLKAGTIRNKQMLDDGKPDFVIAFPGHAGTRHMTSIAKGKGVPTIALFNF